MYLNTLFYRVPRAQSLARTRSSFRLLGILLILCALVPVTAVRAQDRTVLFDISDPGVSKAIPTWGLDTAWLSEDNVRRGVEFMGKPQVDVIRFSFTGDTPVVGGTLTGSGLDEFNTRKAIVNNWTDSHTALYLNNDTASLDSSYSGVNGVNAAAWAELIDVTRQKCEAEVRPVISVSPFNEPDYGTWQGNKTRLGQVCQELRTTYSSGFSGIRLCGGSVLNPDYAYDWYNTLDGWLDEGCTHQLAGTFDNYAGFFESVVGNGERPANDELHNVMEAMVGAEYGLETGIWWYTAERARGEFVKASDGERLGYAEHRPNWTAASVYRAPSGRVQAFVGESERQALPTTYRFFSKDRDVFYDGYGPQRSYTVTTTGGPGYQTSAHKNAERVVDITWGEDVPPPINGQYIVVNRNSEMVMEVQSGNTADGTNIRQNNYSASATYQRWNITPLPASNYDDQSYFTMTAAHSGSAADVYNWSLDAGGDVRQWTYVNGRNQHWFLEYVTNGWFNIRSRWSGKYLEVQSGSAAARANIQQGDGTGAMYQQWRLIPVGADPTDFTAPDQVTGVAAVANPVSVQLSWNASTATDLDGYTVMRATNSGGPYEIIARGLTATSFTDHSANQSIPYYYVVRAVDQSLNRSGNSTEVSATPTGASTLVAHYEFEGDSTDATLNGNDAVASGTTAYGTGLVGTGCLDLGAQSGHLELPAEVVNHDQLTIAAWVNWEGGSAWQRIFDFGNGTGEYLFLTPANSSGTTMQFTIHQNGVGQDLFAPAPTAFQWTHVAVTLNGPAATLYVNGSNVASSASFTITPSDINPVLNYIGKSQEPGNPLFKGSIDDFRIYNFALSAAEVAALADVYVPPPTEMPIALVNAGFEDGPAIFTGFDVPGSDVPGWMDAGAITDSGVDGPGPWFGARDSYAAFHRGGDGGAYQMTGYTIQDGDQLTVGFWAKGWTPYGTDGAELTATLFYDDGAAHDIGDYTATSLVRANTAADYVYFETTIPASVASVGHQLGLRFVNTGVVGSYATLDDVSLLVVNTNAPDATPPEAPTGLAALSDDGSVSLDWATNSEPDLASYSVYRSLTSGSNYTSLASGLASSSYTDNNATNGVRYHYVVTATDSNANESASSSEVSAVPSPTTFTPDEYHIASHTLVGGTNLWLTVSNTVLGHLYGLQATDILTPPSWSNILVEAGNSSNVVFRIPVDPESTSRFFKLDVQRQ